MSTLRTFNLQHPESSNNNIQLAEGGGVSVTAGILTATNVSSTNVTTTEVTATNGTFSGNLSVGGVLTYEDTTNVDSVGVITARDGLHVTGGKVSVGSDNPSGNLNISYLQVGKGQVSSDHSLYNYNTSFTNNAYQNGNGTFAHITNRAVGVINLQDNVLTFSNGPGGTAGQSATLTERLRITSDGNLGIGDASPTKPLTVGTTTPVILLDDQSSRTLEIRGPSTTHSATVLTTSVHDLLLGTNNAERLRIDSSGNATFKYKVSIGDSYGAGEIFKLGKSSGTSYLAHYNGGTAHGFIGYADQLVSGGSATDYAVRATNNLVFATNGNNERLRITSAGNLGIKVTNPDLTLHVNGVNALPSTSGSTPTGHLTLRAKASGSSHGMFMGVSNAAPWSSWIQAQDANNNATNYPLLLNPNGGSVGIGTDNPTFGQSSPVSTYNPKLGVEGSIIIGNLSTTASDRSELQFYRRAGTYSQSIDAHDMGRITWYGSNNDSNNASLAWSIGVTPDGGSWTSGSNRKGFMTFNNHDGEKIRITSGGRIGIGTDNPDQAVEINGTVKFTAGTSTEGSQMLVLPLEDITLASNASASISVGARFTGLIIVAGYTNDTAAGVWAVASASAYSTDAVTRIQFNNHPASNTSDLTITSPNNGGTHQFQLNQTGTVTKTYKVFAMGIYG